MPYFLTENPLPTTDTAVLASGTITGSGGLVFLPSSRTVASTKVLVSGAFSGTLLFEQSVDGVVYTPQAAVPLPPTLGLPQSTTTTTTGTFLVNAASTEGFRVRATSWTSGTASIFINSSEEHSLAFANLLDDGIVLAGNSTTTPLTASQVFSGTAQNVLAFSSLTIHSHADQSGTLQVQWSDDGSDWDDVITYSIAAGQHDHLVFHRRNSWFRLVWTNGTTPQAHFHLQTIGQKVSSIQNIVGVNEALDDNNSAALVRSVIAGKSIASGTTYTNVKVIDHDGLGTFDTPALAVRNITDQYQLSAFNEQRVSAPKRLTDSIQKYGRNTRHSSTGTLSGTVTDTFNMSGFTLAVSGTSGSYARVRTNEWYRYQTGRGQQILLTLIHTDSGQPNQVRNWGYFDTGDGLMWRLSGTSLGVVRRTSTGESGGSLSVPYEQFVSQSAWNVDRLDGTGPSGVTIDVTKGSIWEIRFQWLGSGIVQWYVNEHLCHQMSFPNTLAYHYMRTATLPLSWQVINYAASTGSGFTSICGHVTSESGEQPLEEIYSAVAAPKSTAATEVPLLSIQLTGTFNTVDNRMSVLPRQISLAETNGKPAFVFLRLNPTLTSASWVAADANSGVQYDTTATALSGGQVLARWTIQANGTRDIDLNLFELGGRTIRRDAFSGVSDILTISIARGGVGVDSTVDAFLNWGEVR